MMKSKIRKWGNSLAVRIPSVFAHEMKVEEGASIHMMIEDGALVLRPDHREEWNLCTLIEGMTDENIPGEWETGSPRGRESW